MKNVKAFYFKSKVLALFKVNTLSTYKMKNKQPYELDGCV